MLANTIEAIQGERQSWNLIKKLGEGDAGEVYLVESVLDKQPAILKRPRKSSFFSDILRQANQIKREGTILRGIPKAALQAEGFLWTIPGLIDQNKLENDLGEKTFIVIEQAKGLDIKLLSQIIRFGEASIQELPMSADSKSIIDQWLQFDEFPAPLLVRISLYALYLLENIHSMKIHGDQGAQSGVIWNDVKPEHFFWDPVHVCLTVIDWGNSLYLDNDSVTQDRQYSTIDDFRQYIEEMGNFISEVNPDLYTRLEWPQTSASGDLYTQLIVPLKQKLAGLYENDKTQLHALRQQEAELYDISRPILDHIAQFSSLEKKLAAHGEMPDYMGVNNFMVKAAYPMAAGYDLSGLQKICEKGSKLPGDSSKKWILLNEIVDVARQNVELDERTQAAFSNALASGLVEDWNTALWELFTHLGRRSRPGWWENISQQVRKAYLGLDEDAIPPYTVFARLYYTLQAEVTRKGDQRLLEMANGKTKDDPVGNGFHWQASKELLTSVREEIVEKWKDIEPNPPHSGIGYSAVDSLIDEIDALLPGSRKEADRALAQPKTQVELILNAWEEKDFELARRGLRFLLLWDPDRARLLTAENAISAAPGWLARVHQGASKDEPFYDFLTSVELDGRTLRNQVGPAKWLDRPLEAFKRLRKGTRSVDLMIEYPEIMNELPWLNQYQSREILSLPHTRPITLERDASSTPSISVTEGIVEGRFGPNQSLMLAEALDTWRPEARGSSARVFAGKTSYPGQAPTSYAFKIMRPDQLDYALPLFIEEIQILNILRDVPGITPYVECGFIKIDDDQTIPSDESHASADQLSGQVIHYGAEQTQNHLASMDRQVSSGWLPYLALVKRNPEHNFLRFCDASYTHGWFLSLRDSLILALQICDILQFAHDRNITYRDHKILHYYWDAYTQGVSIIDWNIAKRQPQGLSEAEKQFDLVQFGARGLHHIFTGRPAQGSLPLGPNRPEDIEKASTHYPVNWTFDDERLPNQLRTILEKTLNQGYTQVRDIRQDLLGIYQQLPGPDKI